MLACPNETSPWDICCVSTEVDLVPLVGQLTYRNQLFFKFWGIEYIDKLDFTVLQRYPFNWDGCAISKEKYFVTKVCLLVGLPPIRGF